MIYIPLCIIMTKLTHSALLLRLGGLDFFQMEFGSSPGCCVAVHTSMYLYLLGAKTRTCVLLTTFGQTPIKTLSIFLIQKPSLLSYYFVHKFTVWAKIHKQKLVYYRIFTRFVRENFHILPLLEQLVQPKPWIFDVWCFFMSIQIQSIYLVCIL